MTGRCFCGNVVFEFDGPITDTFEGDHVPCRIGL